MAYEALYRRYRPSRFKDAFFGQEHVVAALGNAVEGDRVGHAYLFSGPRGTGKTTSARILAKALNCTNLQGGEPCDKCDSCLAFQSGSSYDLHELDAASNNGVDAMRDLIGKVALGSPGRTKVYILDEVHMLSSGAENALLKTLEEPPPHVVFVLCTTEPNKVVPTIRSRTQHLEFSLLSASQVGELIDYVVSDAGLEITAEDRAYVVRAGGGSARDTLSALDQVVAAGGAPQGGEFLDALFQSLIDRDAGAALAAIDGALTAGRDAASVSTALLHEMRTVFLAALRADVSHLPEAEQLRATERAKAMSPARITRAIEVIGTSVIEMRQAPDPRVDLEVAIMRLTRSDLDTDPAAILERVSAIESQLAGGAPIVTSPSVPTAVASDRPVPPPVQPASLPTQVSVAPQAPNHHQPPAVAAPVAAPVPQAQPPAAQAPAAPTAPVPQEPSPEAAPAPSPPQGGGARGAAIARAELARQSTESAAAAPVTQTPASAPAGAPASSGKTLADVRRERQAAAQATGDPATEAASVEAAAEARRERQAVAQIAGQEAEQPSAQVPAVQAESVPAVQAEPAAAPPAVAPPAVADQMPPVQTEAATAPSPAATGDAGLPALTELEAAWPSILQATAGRVKARFGAGHFMETATDAAIFGLPNPVHRDRCEEIRAEVDQAIAAHFGRPVPLRLVVDETDPEPDFFAPPSGGAGEVAETETAAFEEEEVDVHDLVDATGDVPSAQDRVMTTFENSTLLEDPETPQ